MRSRKAGRRRSTGRTQTIAIFRAPSRSYETALGSGLALAAELERVFLYTVQLDAAAIALSGATSHRIGESPGKSRSYLAPETRNPPRKAGLCFGEPGR